MIETRVLSEPETAILRALFDCDEAVDLKVLLEIADPREKLSLSLSAVRGSLDLLERDRLVIKSGEADATRWQISHRGSAKLITREAREIFSSGRVAGPIQATVCNAVEPPIEEERIPLASSALICLREDDLDGWWSELDVDCKADAFARFALRMHSGDGYVEVERAPSRIPVIGAIGDALADAGMPRGVAQ